MAFYKFYLVAQVLLMYQILPLVCCYQNRDRDMDSARIQNSTVTLSRQLASAEPRLLALFKGFLFGIKAIIKSVKFFTPEIKGGLCIVKYMLILEDPRLANAIDTDAIAKWLHTLRRYVSDLLPGDREAEEAANLITRQRIESKVRESLQYDENLFALPRNITNYANEGESYDSVYPKCLRISSRTEETNSPCGEPTNRENSRQISPTNALKINLGSPPGDTPKKYYSRELRIVNMVMNYMELQPEQLRNLNISHCLNFYTFGLLTRLFDGLWR